MTEVGYRPAADAIVHVSGTTLGARSDSSGLYRVIRVPAGSYTLRVAKIGFSPESATVIVQNGQSVTQNFELHPLVQELTGITVTSNRLGESEAAALQRKAECSECRGCACGRCHSCTAERQCCRSGEPDAWRDDRT